MSTPMHTRRQNFQAFSRYVGLGVPHFLILNIPQLSSLPRSFLCYFLSLILRIYLTFLSVSIATKYAHVTHNEPVLGVF